MAWKFLNCQTWPYGLKPEEGKMVHFCSREELNSRPLSISLIHHALYYSSFMWHIIFGCPFILPNVAFRLVKPKEGKGSFMLVARIELTTSSYFLPTFLRCTTVSVVSYISISLFLFFVVSSIVSKIRTRANSPSPVYVTNLDGLGLGPMSLTKETKEEMGWTLLGHLTQ